MFSNFCHVLKCVTKIAFLLVKLVFTFGFCHSGVRNIALLHPTCNKDKYFFFDFTSFFSDISSLHYHIAS